MNVNKDDITKFFGDVKTMFKPNQPEKTQPVQKVSDYQVASSPVPDMIDPTTPLKKTQTDAIGTQRTNIIYLNTDCNLRCEYCYETDSRNGLPDQVKITTDEIDSFLLEICKREVGKVSTIVLMGGEPFLNFELIEYIMLKAASLVEQKGSGWGMSIISNGTLFTDKLLTRYKQLIDTVSKHKVYVAQEVSFDGSGQYRRKWPNGSNSREHVEEGMKRLMKYEIPFKMSYTVHSGNYKNMLQDLIYILENYPKPYHYRVTVGYAYQDLDDTLGPQGSYKLKEDFKPYAEELFKIYGVPLCGNTCGVCKECDQSSFVGNAYLSPTTGLSYDEKKTSHNFQQW